MGYIDQFSEYSLYDIVDGSLGFEDKGRGFEEPAGTVEFYGFHIFPTNDDGDYMVQYDGHMGEVDSFNSDDYDDVLELVDDMMGHVFTLHNILTTNDKDTEALVEFAGRIAVDEGDERAKKQPDLYFEIPDEAREQ